MLKYLIPGNGMDYHVAALNPAAANLDRVRKIVRSAKGNGRSEISYILDFKSLIEKPAIDHALKENVVLTGKIIS